MAPATAAPFLLGTVMHIRRACPIVTMLVLIGSWMPAWATSEQLPSAPPATTPTGATRPPIFIERIIIDGNTVFPVQELQAIVHPYEQRVVSLAEVEALRQRLTHYYIDHGYSNSGALVPAGHFPRGELHFQIIEGKLDRIRLHGMGRLRAGYVKNRLWNDPTQPFNLRELQERFQLLLSDPLIRQMNGRILPEDTPGHSELDVEVIRSQPYHLSVFANNQRPPSVGSTSYGITGLVRNVTGMGDEMNLTVSTSQGGNEYAGEITLPLTDAGIRAFFRFDEGNSAVIEEPLKPINIRSTANTLEGGVRFPVRNTLHQSLTMGLSLAIQESDTTLLGQPFSFVPGNSSGHSQASVVRLFQYYSQQWEKHAFALHSCFNIGVDAWGATMATAPQYPGSRFFSWLGQAQYVYHMPNDGTQFLIRSNVQYSDSPLLPQERIAVGGFSTVRGYRENQLVRDQGYTLSMELHYPLFGSTNPKAIQSLLLVPFVDYGKSWNYQEPSTDIASVGLGVNWQYRHVHAELYYGYALRKLSPEQSGDLQDEGIHFQIRVDIL